MSDDAQTLMYWIRAYHSQRCADEPVKNEAYFSARRWAEHIISA